MNLLEEFFCCGLTDAQCVTFARILSDSGQALEADVAMVGTGIAAISASDRWHCSCLPWMKREHEAMSWIVKPWNGCICQAEFVFATSLSHPACRQHMLGSMCEWLRAARELVPGHISTVSTLDLLQCFSCSFGQAVHLGTLLMAEVRSHYVSLCLTCSKACSRPPELQGPAT